MSRPKIVNGVLVPIENTESREKKNEKNSANRAGSSRSGNIDIGIVDPQWELIDPTPDIYAMFVQFDERFFWKSLGRCEIKWSKRMTTCAGICSYRGRFGSCVITLSEPLLKLRPRKDLVETMLHEMIHAYLFISEQNQDRDGHGPNFQAHMNRINSETGTAITIYHSFHAEVAVYKQHWWRCDGPCRNERPFYGWVKRAMNRAPGPSDRWWSQHQAKCNGKYVKVKEPEKPAKPEKEKATQKRKNEGETSEKPKAKKEVGQQSITKWFGGSKCTGTSTSQKPPASSIPSTSTSSENSKKWIGGSGKLGGSHLPVSKLVSSHKSGGAAPSQSSSSTVIAGNSIPTDKRVEPIYVDLTSTSEKDSDFEKAILMSLVNSPTPNPATVSSDDELALAIAMSLSQQPSTSGQSNSSRSQQRAPTEVVVLGDSPVSLLSRNSRNVACPSCGSRMAEDAVNSHLDLCLS